MEKEFALFIADLEYGLKNTKCAEDRNLYEKYLAQAACIMGKIILGAPKTEIFEEIDTNERLWGNTWLQDPVYKKSANSYKKF
tara:strand:- start:597 stop:845 length:249 start_codon:yes stop_codon:yes gene_type:complete